MSRISFSIDMPIMPRWRNIELLRTSILNCLAAIFQNSDFCEHVGMAASELMENAVKYGDWSRPDRSLFKLLVTGDDASVQIAVSNPVEPGSNRARELLGTVEWIGTFESAHEAYRARLLMVAANPPEEGKSGLGLVRVAYEANCVLTADLSDAGVLRVQATSRPRVSAQAMSIIRPT